MRWSFPYFATCNWEFSRNSSPAQLLLLVIFCYAFYVLLQRSSTISIHSGAKRFVIHNGFCVRPYLHAGSDVTIRLLSNPSDLNDFFLASMPRDDPRVFHDDLTLLAHSSASALDEKYLNKLLSNWRGPISLAISLQGPFNEEFVKKKVEATLRLLKNADDASRFSVHVLFERFEDQTCEESERSLLEATPPPDIFFAKYPINTVRNVARLFSTTRYIAFADSDYLFSSGFCKKILPILRENIPLDSENALLYRIFELEEEDSSSKNDDLTKSDLNELIEAKRARVFHGKRWPQGHSVPNLTEWLNVQESEHPGLFNLNITLKNRPVWEFQFTGLRDVPLFDENFPYRVDNNLELRWEVCRAGYRLLPVEDLFVYHTLSNDENDKDDSRKKQTIKRKNSGIASKAKKAFTERMNQLYPNKKANCPV